jgi:isoleucyl-tRNA synthetase
MDRVRAVCSTVLALREERRLPVRQPLATLEISGLDLGGYRELVEDETNVKRVVESAVRVREVPTVNFKVAGPRLGAKLKSLAADIKAGDFRYDAQANTVVSNRSVDLQLRGDLGEFVMRVMPEDVQDGFAVAVVPGTRIVVRLDTNLTPELIRQGLVRNVVRLVQQARKDAGLRVSDRIRLRIAGDTELDRAVETHADYIREQTLAIELELGLPEPGMHVSEGEVGETQATIALVRA